MDISLQVLPETYAMFKIRSLDELHPRFIESKVRIIAQAADEVSVLCDEEYLPDSYLSLSAGWRLLKLSGILDDNLVGTVSRITSPLADAGVSVIVNTTYDSGYFGVKQEDLDVTVDKLVRAGVSIQTK